MLNALSKSIIHKSEVKLIRAKEQVNGLPFTRYLLPTKGCREKVKGIPFNREYFNKHFARHEYCLTFFQSSDLLCISDRLCKDMGICCFLFETYDIAHFPSLVHRMNLPISIFITNCTGISPLTTNQYSIPKSI